MRELPGVHIEIALDPFHDHMHAALHQKGQDIGLFPGGTGQGDVDAQALQHILNEPAPEPFAARVEKQDAEQRRVAFDVV